ncbi:MAG: 3-deoxy-7-phosphoheptulonate synthase, partial [Phycisphaerales bacterium]|nr:3-deoxy-7-phosphoheptulonate synthase [Phycisphaerales bacterium]
MTWSPTSWQEKETAQQPSYASEGDLLKAEQVVASLPPLVSSFEIEALKAQIAEATQGKRFLLQAGDCAERFLDCRPEHITGQLKVILQMSLVLVHSMNKSVVRVGRIAGQFAKPRSSDIEQVDGASLPSYRGD